MRAGGQGLGALGARLRVSGLGFVVYDPTARAWSSE